MREDRPPVFVAVVPRDPLLTAALLSHGRLDAGSRPTPGIGAGNTYLSGTPARPGGDGDSCAVVSRPAESSLSQLLVVGPIPITANAFEEQEKDKEQEEEKDEEKDKEKEDEKEEEKEEEEEEE